MVSTHILIKKIVQCISKNIIIIILLFVIGSFFGFGLFHLDKFETVDEHFWKDERITKYWKVFSERDLIKTAINDKPGISIALVSGLGLITSPEPGNHRIRDREITENNLYTVYDPVQTRKNNFSLRLPILLFNTLFLFFFFWIIRRITNNDWIALWTVIFIGLSPILVGISQIINPDSLLWTFSAGALFSYFALLKTQERKFLILTSLLTGFVLLSKYTGNIMFAFYLLFFALFFIFSFKKIQEKNIGDFIKRESIHLLLIPLGAFLVFAFFLPAVFIKFNYFARGTYNFAEPYSQYLYLGMFIIPLLLLCDVYFFKTKISTLFGKIFYRKRNLILRITVLLSFCFFLFVFYNGISGQHIVPFDLMRDEAYQNKNLTFGTLLDNQSAPLQFLAAFSTQAYPFVFSIIPILLFLIMGYWFYAIVFSAKKDSHYIAFFSIIPLLYFASALGSGVLTNIRYTIILYPFFAFFGALALSVLCNSLYVSINKKITISYGTIYSIASLLIIICSINALWQSKPFYFNYTSNFLPKDFIITDSWGYGSYEAANYLNNLPNATKLIIWSDRSAVCQYFVGKCIRDYKIDLTKTIPDYFVISRRGTIRHTFEWKYKSLAHKTRTFYYTTEPVWSLFIGDRPDNFIKIVKSEEN